MTEPRIDAARLAAVGGHEDSRPLDQVLDELEALARPALEQLAIRQREGRQGDAWQDVERLRDAVADGDRAAAPALLQAIGRARVAHGIRPEPRVSSLRERLLARLTSPPLVHVPTDFPTLDSATRGGLLLRRVTVLGGEPDAGKTAILVQMLLRAAREGYVVGLYAVDEPGEGIEDRIGQSFGLALDDMEANLKRAIEWLMDATDKLPNFLLMEQGAEDVHAIEDAADRVLSYARRNGYKGAILGVDSLQTAHCRAFYEPNPPRMTPDKIEAVTATLKATAKRGLGVIVTSELNRDAYAHRPGAKPKSPMAAFKGSGSIEYCMTVGVVVTTILTGEHAGDVVLSLPKNKRGDRAYRGAKIRLERDPDRCTYTDRGRIDEEDSPAGDPRERTKAAEKPVGETVLERVRFELKKRPRGLAGGIEALIVAVGGKTGQTRRAVRQLQAAEEIVRRGDRLFHRDTPDLEALDAKPDTARELGDRILEWFDGQVAAGRPVPSRRAVEKGLLDTGKGARGADVRDAITVLVAAGELRETKGRGIIRT